MLSKPLSSNKKAYHCNQQHLLKRILHIPALTGIVNFTEMHLYGIVHPNPISNHPQKVQIILLFSLFFCVHIP